MDMVSVAQRLREWQKGRYASVGEFAAACNISIAQASHYLNGRTHPGNKLQMKLRELG